MLIYQGKQFYLGYDCDFMGIYFGGIVTFYWGFFWRYNVGVKPSILWEYNLGYDSGFETNHFMGSDS
jgi:hypothetical protein